MLRSHLNSIFSMKIEERSQDHCLVYLGSRSSHVCRGFESHLSSSFFISMEKEMLRSVVSPCLEFCTVGLTVLMFVDVGIGAL